MSVLINHRTVNGHEYELSDTRDFDAMLGSLGMSIEDVKEMYGLVDDNVVDTSCYDGLVGDDWFIFLEGLEAVFDELKDNVMPRLKGDGRKKENKKDVIVRILDSAISNLDSLIH